jgi:hypothetical protein
VLVERVENFATEKEWKRAYGEINDFERMLTDDGAIIVKIYMHISKEEQLFRFKRREADPMKHWKINEEDWRNRKKWEQHNEAAEDMFDKTSSRVLRRGTFLPPISSGGRAFGRSKPCRFAGEGEVEKELVNAEPNLVARRGLRPHGLRQTNHR